MEPIMPEEITAEDRAALARLRAESRLKEVIEPWLEHRRCKALGISYDAEKPEEHQKQIALADRALAEMIAAHTRNWKWLGAAGRAVGAGSASLFTKVWNLLMGALALLGLGWVATRMGIKLPGIP